MKGIDYPVVIQCKQCGADIVCNNSHELYPKSDKMRKFCNRSCAASYNNNLRVRFPDERHKTGVSVRLHFLKNLFTGNVTTSGANFRRQARTIIGFFNITHCEYPGCNYSTILHIHHIGRTKENDYKKLALLCPNHHAEIHGGYADESLLIAVVLSRIEEYKDRIYDIVNSHE